MKPTSRHRGKNPEYQTVGVKPTSRHCVKNLEYQTVGVKPTSGHRGKNPEYQTVGVKPTSRHRGKNPEYQTVGSNRPHGNVATNKPSGQTDLTITWKLNKPLGKPDLMVVELIYDRWIKPTSRHGGNPNVLQYNH